MSRKKQTAFTRPALLSHGFRLFFLLAIGFGVIVIPYWLAVFFGLVEFTGPFNPVDWHIHEMIFGYAAAVITGFLFTAIPNWTGRLPINGLRLGGLACLWLVGRCAVLGIGGFGPIWVLLLDCSFITAVLCTAVIEIVAGKNWRNLIVVLPMGLLLSANIWFHLEIMSTGGADFGRRLGLGVVVFLITLIGGRVIPSFTRNWLVKQDAEKLPTPMNRFDGICLVSGAVSLLVWVCLPNSSVTAGLLVVAGVLHTLRLFRWQGHQTLPSPLLFILHLSYAFVPLGFVLTGFGFATQGVHIFGIGAIGGMTVAVMIRASAGHTGRELDISRGVLVGFLLLPLSALMRVFATVMETYSHHVLICSAVLWTVGFTIILVQIGPWLLSASPAKRSANPH